MSSSLVKFIPSTPNTDTPSTANKRARSPYLSTKTTTIAIILFSIFLLVISKFTISQFSSSQSLNQNLDPDLYPETQVPESVAGAEPGAEFDSEHDHDCPYSVPKRRSDNDTAKSGQDSNFTFPSVSSSGEFWISDLGPIESVHVKLNSSTS